MADNNKPDVVIRVAEFKDASAIAELLKDSFAEYKQLYTKKAYCETALGVYKVKERIYNKNVLIVLVDNVISGTISLIPAGLTLYIKSVAVAPAARRRGLGNTMMKYAERQALKRGFQYLELTTTHFLTDAIRLYENLDFEQRGQKDLYGTPLIRMVKNLNPYRISPDKKATTYNH